MMRSLFAFGPASLFYVHASTHHHVGVKDFFLETSKAPVRVYYPATKSQNSEPVRIFRDSTNFLKGFLWRVTRNRLLYGIVSKIISVFRFFIPMHYAVVPNTSSNAHPFGERLPLLIFSHGLTGTGEENTILLASIASHGYVVASVHHTDGSSVLVTDGDNKKIWYKYPDPKNYSINFREGQLNHRVKEVMDVKKAILTQAEFKNRIDDSKVVASGFSYGGATAALATVRNPNDFNACLVIDGWFFINDYGLKREFPLDVIKAKTLPVPTFFLNCSDFMKNGNGVIARRIANASSKHRHEVYGCNTKHQLFVDLKRSFPGFLWSPVKREDSKGLAAKYKKDVIEWLIMVGRGDPS